MSNPPSMNSSPEKELANKEVTQIKELNNLHQLIQHQKDQKDQKNNKMGILLKNLIPYQ